MLALACPEIARAAPSSDLPDVTDEPEPPAETRDVDDEQLERAMTAFARGSAAYSDARYQQALGDFLEAATLYASPDFQYNIGLCYEKLGKPEEAIGAFETYLKTKRNVPDRANVEDRIARQREELERRAASAKRAANVTPPIEPEPDGRGLVIAGATVTGLGAAVAIGGGLGLGIAAGRRSDEVDAVTNGGNPDGRTFGETRDIADRGKALELGQVITVAVGGGIALAGIAMLAVGLSRRAKAKATSSSGAGPTATLAPDFGRAGVGLLLSGRF